MLGVTPGGVVWNLIYMLSHAGGAGGTKGFGVVLRQKLEVLAVLNGGAKSIHPLKGGS